MSLEALVSPQFARKFFGKSIKYQEKQNDFQDNKLHRKIRERLKCKTIYGLNVTRKGLENAFILCQLLG